MYESSANEDILVIAMDKKYFFHRQVEVGDPSQTNAADCK